jgi:hypothetical protein
MEILVGGGGCIKKSVRSSRVVCVPTKTNLKEK